MILFMSYFLYSLCFYFIFLFSFGGVGALFYMFELAACLLCAITIFLELCYISSQFLVDCCYPFPFAVLHGLNLPSYVARSLQNCCCICIRIPKQAWFWRIPYNPNNTFEDPSNIVSEI